MSAIYELAKLEVRFDVSKKCGKGHISLNETCQIGKAKPTKEKTQKKEKAPEKSEKEYQRIFLEAKENAKYPLVERFFNASAIAKDKGDVTIPKIPKGDDKNDPNFVRGFTVMEGRNPVKVIDLPKSRGSGSGYHEYAEVGETFVSVTGGRATPKVVLSDKESASSPFGKNYAVNLFGKNAGWKWNSKEDILEERKKVKVEDKEGNEVEKDVGFTRKMNIKDDKGNTIALGTTKDSDGNDHPAIISVADGSKHHYALSFESNVKSELRYYKNQKDEPRNKFAAKGQLVLGNPIGSFTRSGRVNLVYDRVSIEPKMEKDTPDIVQVKKGDRKDSIQRQKRVWVNISFL